MRRALTIALVISLGTLARAQEPAPKRVVVGSKAFTESRVLSEIIAQLIEAHTELEVERRFGLGGTKICFDALKSAEIDLYPEYTGTGLVTILEGEPHGDPLQTYFSVRRQFLERYDLVWLAPFGFSNTYAMAMPEHKATQLGIKTISDLSPHAGSLRVGLSLEFLNRKDGWPGLSESYGLGAAKVRGMEHGLAYAAVASGEIDLIDAYSTDGKLLRYRLTVLEDDRGFFPHYHGAPVVRAEALAAHPALGPLLDRLALRLPADRMQRLNFQVEEEKRPFKEVARAFLQTEGLIEGAPAASNEPSARKRGFFALFAARWRKTLTLAGQHLALSLAGVLLAVLVSVPLGILCTRVPALAQPILGGAGVIQTIPSLALLAVMIPIPGLGLGPTSAIVALFLYALLPIIRNTYTGIQGVEADLIEAARGMGLTDAQILRVVQLPLATRTIMAGVRTATVISIGVATLAAFIGAGGLGEPIITGLQLNDNNLILTGAIPAALLAVCVDALLGGVERLLVPRGLTPAAPLVARAL